MAATEHIPSTNGKFQKVIGLLQGTDGTDIGEDNPLPSKLVDSSGRTGTNTVFGDTTFGQRIPTLSAQFYYTLPGNVATSEIVSTGSINQDNAMLQLNTGTGTDGEARIFSTQSLRYVPGYEAFFFTTAVFTEGVANSHQRVGLYDDTDGFFLGYEGSTFGFTRRRAGVDNFYEISTDDLTLKDGTVIDPLKGNVYKISYGYLGFATITLEVMNIEGGLEVIKKIKYPNTSTQTHIENTYLSARAEVINDGNNTNLNVKVGSICGGIVDGGGADVTGRVKAFPSTTKTQATGTLIVYRNRSTFDSKSNKITARLKKVSLSSEGNKPVKFTIYRDPAFTGTPTWNDVDTTGSIIEYSTDAVIDTANSSDIIDFYTIGKSSSENLMIDGTNLFLSPGQSLGVYTESASTSDVTIGYMWNEEF